MRRARRWERVCMYVDVDMCAHTHTWTHTHICVHTHMDTHTHICAHTHMDTHTHTYETPYFRRGPYRTRGREGGTLAGRKPPPKSLLGFSQRLLLASAGTAGAATFRLTGHGGGGSTTRSDSWRRAMPQRKGEPGWAGSGRRVSDGLTEENLDPRPRRSKPPRQARARPGRVPERSDGAWLPPGRYGNEGSRYSNDAATVMGIS